MKFRPNNRRSGPGRARPAETGKPPRSNLLAYFRSSG
jgi:hypothetical protein